jgi:hypothetical protein
MMTMVAGHDGYWWMVMMGGGGVQTRARVQLREAHVDKSHLPSKLRVERRKEYCNVTAFD